MAIKHIVFDWGDTIMRDLSFPGPMKNWPNVYLIPDIEKALEILAKNFTLHVGSNAGDSVSADIEEALEKVGILRYFSNVFSSKDIGYEKPQPEFFESIRIHLQSKSEELLMIGNSCKNDIEGARIDGWLTIWFNENQQSNKKCDSANAIIFHMSHLAELVNELNQHDDI